MADRTADRHRIVVALREAGHPLTSRELTDSLFVSADERDFQHNRGIVSSLVTQMVSAGMLRKEGKRLDPVSGAHVWEYGIAPEGGASRPVVFEVPADCAVPTGDGRVRITVEDPSALISKIYALMHAGEGCE